MDPSRAIHLLGALAQETRLAAFRLLVESGIDGLPAGEVGKALGVLQNTMSGHLAALADAELITGVRNGRVIRYRVEASTVQALMEFLAMDVCCGRPEFCGPLAAQDALPFAKAWAAGRRFNVLFLCTANSARSIMAEAILRHDHAGRFRAFSAGSTPSGKVRPEVLDLLERLGYPISGLASKGWAEFSRFGVPVMDFVFTLCDESAREVCPAWPGDPLTAHWGVPDPAAEHNGSRNSLTFADTFRMLERRIGAFANLPFADLERMSLQRRLDAIGLDTADLV